MKILIAEPIHTVLNERLINKSFDTDELFSTTKDELIQIIGNYDGIVIRSRFKIDKAIIDRAKKLKFIARAGSGIENIDTEYAKVKGITIFNSPEGNANAVGEHALGLLLDLFHKITKSATEVNSGVWDRKANQGIELSGKTIGIIGYGNTGSKFAKTLSGFDTRILAYDKYKTGFSNNFAEECSVNEIFAEADIVSFHVPLTKETKYMGNIDFFLNFKKNVYLLNTSRGEVINTKDLVKALETGTVAGAGLDVLEYEKHSFDTIFEEETGTLKKLLKMSNTIITPHIAGSTKESVFKIADILATKIITKYR